MSDVTLWGFSGPVTRMCPNRVEELEARVKEAGAILEALGGVPDVEDDDLPF